MNVFCWKRNWRVNSLPNNELNISDDELTVLSDIGREHWGLAQTMQVSAETMTTGRSYYYILLCNIWVNYFIFTFCCENLILLSMSHHLCCLWRLDCIVFVDPLNKIEITLFWGVFFFFTKNGQLSYIQYDVLHIYLGMLRWKISSPEILHTVNKIIVEPKRNLEGERKITIREKNIEAKMKLKTLSEEHTTQISISTSWTKQNIE